MWAVADADEAVELLTGVAAGVPDEQGRMAAGSMSRRVVEGLRKLARMQREFARRGHEDDADAAGTSGRLHASLTQVARAERVGTGRTFAAVRAIFVGLSRLAGARRRYATRSFTVASLR